MSKYVIPGFFKGMVSKKAGSKLDDEYRQKASELVNFYNDNNRVITRRPPLEKWDLPEGHRFEDKSNILDYVKLDSGEELLLQKGITNEDLLTILFRDDDGLFASTDFRTTYDATRRNYTLNGSRYVKFNTQAGTDVPSQDAPQPVVQYIFHLDMENAITVRRRSSNKVDILFSSDVERIPFVSIAPSQDPPPNTPSKVGAWKFHAQIGEALKVSAAPVHLAGKESLKFTRTNEKRRFTSTISQENVLPDKINVSDGTARLFVNSVEYSYDKNSDTFTSPVFRDFIDSPSNLGLIDIKELSGSPIENKIIEPAIRIAALYSNVGGQEDEMTKDKYLELIGDWSLSEIENFVANSGASISLPIEEREKFPADDPKFETTFPKLKMEIVLGRVIENIKDRLMPVTTVIPTEDGFKIAPDVKLGTSNNKVKSIFEELYKDDEIQVWSYPERNDRSFLDDVPTQVGKLSKNSTGALATAANLNNRIPDGTFPASSDRALDPVAIDYRIDASVGSIESDPASGEEYFRDITREEAGKLGEDGTAFPFSVDKERGIGLDDYIDSRPVTGLNDAEFIQDNTVFQLMPKTWIQRVADNGGSLYRLAKKLINLLAKEQSENSGVVTETDETRRITEKLEGKDPIDIQRTSSWGFSTAPGTDETFITGAGHGRYSGVGACFVALPFNEDWSFKDYNEHRKLGVHTSSIGIAPFITKVRSLTDRLLFHSKRYNAHRRIGAVISAISGSFFQLLRKAYEYDVVANEGYDSIEENFTPTHFRRLQSGTADVFSVNRKYLSLTQKMPSHLKSLNIIHREQAIHMLHAAYCRSPRAIKFRVYYDYSHPALKKWYDDKQLVNLSIPTEFGIDEIASGKGFENIVLMKETVEVDNPGQDIDNIGDIYHKTYRKDNGNYVADIDNRDIISGANASNNVFPSVNTDVDVPEVRGTWKDQFLLRLFDLPVFTNIDPSEEGESLAVLKYIKLVIPEGELSIPANADIDLYDLHYGYSAGSGYQDGIGNSLNILHGGRQLYGSFWFGTQPMMLPGPTYRKVRGNASGFYPLKEKDPPYSAPYFLGNMKDIDTTITTKIELQRDAVADFSLSRGHRGHEAPMSCYSTNVYNFDLSTRTTNTVQKSRDINFGVENLYISKHELFGDKSKSDTVAQYWAGNHNLPKNDIVRSVRDIPSLGPNDTYPTYTSQILTFNEDINSVNEHEGHLLVATDNQVLRISRSSLGPNTYPTTAQVMSRGLDTNIVHESTNYFGGQGDQLVSFKYYEQAQGFIGHNETNEYTPGILTQVETFIQKHNLLVAVEGGSNSIHILTFGGDRRTNGFSRFDFPNDVTHIRKLDHDRMLIFFEGSRPKILDFNARNKGIKYSDYLEDGPKQTYESVASTLPIINLGADNFKAVKYASIKSIMIYLAEKVTAFTISIKSKNSEVVRGVNMNDILSDTNPYSAARPFLLEGLPGNASVAPIISIKTHSDDNLEFSSIVLDLKDI